MLAGGAAVAQLIPAAVSPLVSRLYSPADFGELALYTAIVSTVVVVASFRFELAIPIPTDEQEARSLLALSILITGLMSLACSAVVAIAGDSVGVRLGAARLVAYLWLVPLSVLGAGVYQALSYWTIRQRSYATLARTRVTQSIATVGAQVGLPLLVSGPVGLFVGDLAGRSAGSLSLARETVKQSPGGPSITWQGLFDAARKFWRFPLLSSGSALLNALGLTLSPMLMTATYGPGQAGLLAFGQRIVGLPLALIGQSLGQVYLAEAASLAVTNRSHLKQLFLRTSKRLAIGGLLPLVVMVTAGPRLFGLVFGQDWRVAGTFIQVQAAAFFLQLVVVPTSTTLTLMDRQDLQLFWDAGRLVAVGSVFVVAQNQQWQPITAVVWLGLAMLGSYTVLWLMTLREVNRPPRHGERIERNVEPPRQRQP